MRGRDRDLLRLNQIALSCHNNAITMALLSASAMNFYPGCVRWMQKLAGRFVASAREKTCQKRVATRALRENLVVDQ